jgi:hypothetical protein
MTGPPIILVAGYPKTRGIQCYVQGGVTAAIYNSDDILTGALIPPRSTTPIFAPSIVWYTANNTQVGYLQGQIQGIFTAAQMALVQPSITYTLIGLRALSSSPTNPEIICRRPLLIVPLAYP